MVQFHQTKVDKVLNFAKKEIAGGLERTTQRIGSQTFMSL